VDLSKDVLVCALNIELFGHFGYLVQNSKPPLYTVRINGKCVLEVFDGFDTCSVERLVCSEIRSIFERSSSVNSISSLCTPVACLQNIAIG
jgi:hypothetical protein